MIDLKQLLILRRLRAALKEADISEIETIQNNLELIRQERQNQIDEINAENEEKKRHVEEIKKMMNDWNMSIEDLDERGMLNGYKTEKQKKRSIKPKYKYTALDGQELMWTGQGKIPNSLKQLMQEKGTTLSDYLI